MRDGRQPGWWWRGPARALRGARAWLQGALSPHLEGVTGAPPGTPSSLQEDAQRDVLRRLRAARQGLAEAASADDIYRLLAQAAPRATGADAAFIAALQGEELRPVASRETLPAGGRIALAELADTGLPACLEGRRDLLVAGPDSGEAKVIRRLLGRADIRHALCAPLRVNGQTRALLLVARRRSEAAFSLSEGELARMLASHGSLALERLERRRLAAVGRMAGDLAHQIRESMAEVEAAADLAEAAAPEAIRHTRMIRAQSERIVEMSQQLLDSTCGQHSLSPRAVEIGEFMLGLAETHALLLAQAGIDLELDLTWGSALFDPAMLGRAVSNLIDNARDAMPWGGVLILRARREEEALVVEVEDSGQGMSPEVLTRFLEPYFTHGKQHGTGLGTAVARAIAEAHGGRVEARSKVGQGTCIRLHLPQPPAEDTGARHRRPLPPG